VLFFWKSRICAPGRGLHPGGFSF